MLFLDAQKVLRKTLSWSMFLLSLCQNTSIKSHNLEVPVQSTSKGTYLLPLWRLHKVIEQKSKINKLNLNQLDAYRPEFDDLRRKWS